MQVETSQCKKRRGREDFPSNLSLFLQKVQSLSLSKKGDLVWINKQRNFIKTVRIVYVLRESRDVAANSKSAMLLGRKQTRPTLLSMHSG